MTASAARTPDLAEHQFLPYTLITPRHAITHGHNMGSPGYQSGWAGRKVWFANSGGVVLATVQAGYVHYGLGDQLDYSIVVFSNSVSGITPMPVMVPPPDWTRGGRVFHALCVTGNISTHTSCDNVGEWIWAGNSGSPLVFPMPDNTLVMFHGAGMSGPTAAPPATDPIQADINYLNGLCNISEQYNLTWYYP